jgi:proteasome activator subunit 4
VIGELRYIRRNATSHIARDSSYYLNENQYTAEKNVARQYGGQKVWPRAVYIRRAR